MGNAALNPRLHVKWWMRGWQPPSITLTDTFCYFICCDVTPWLIHGSSPCPFPSTKSLSHTVTRQHSTSHHDEPLEPSNEPVISHSCSHILDLRARKKHSRRWYHILQMDKYALWWATQHTARIPIKAKYLYCFVAASLIVTRPPGTALPGNNSKIIIYYTMWIRHWFQFMSSGIRVFKYVNNVTSK